MANEKTSKKQGKLASKVLRTGIATPKESRSLAGGELTKRPDHKKPAKKTKK